MKEMLLRGEWCCAPPFGYDIVRRNGSREIIVNAQGKLLRKAFYWKAKEKLASEEIKRKLASLGLKVSSQRLSDVLRNPFYCGQMAHNLLNGQVVPGKHEKLISEELFLEVNGIMALNTQGYSTNPENEFVPLKRFLKCDGCGQYLRAYKAKKNQEYYYKCYTTGCSCNRRADYLHQRFKEILSWYSIQMDDDTAWTLKQQLVATYNQLNEDGDGERDTIAKQAAEVLSKLDRLEERFVMEEITKEMYEKYSSKLRSEQKELEGKLRSTGKRVSNLESCIDSAIEFWPNSLQYWI